MLPGENRMQRNIKELARMMNGKLRGDGTWMPAFVRTCATTLRSCTDYCIGLGCNKSKGRLDIDL